MTTRGLVIFVLPWRGFVSVVLRSGERRVESASPPPTHIIIILLHSTLRQISLDACKAIPAQASEALPQSHQTRDHQIPKGALVQRQSARDDGGHGTATLRGVAVTLAQVGRGDIQERRVVLLVSLGRACKRKNGLPDRTKPSQLAVRSTGSCSPRLAPAICAACVSRHRASSIESVGFGGTGRRCVRSNLSKS